MYTESYLLDQDCESLVLKWFGELYILGTLVVYCERSHNHVSLAPKKLSHHAVPLFLVAVIYLDKAMEKYAFEFILLNFLLNTFHNVTVLWVRTSLFPGSLASLVV